MSNTSTITKPRATRKARTPKAPADVRVCIQVMDMMRGLYSARSSDGSTLYVCDVAARTCTCPAGDNHFANCKEYGTCKHLLAARVIGRGLASMSHEARVVAAQCCAWVKVNRVVVESLDAPVGQPTLAKPLPEPVDIKTWHDASGLMEAFG